MSEPNTLTPPQMIGPSAVEALAEAARKASAAAYAPYSSFPVGAAVLAADGAIFAACNVENASYGLCICAERAAVFAAVAAGVRRILAVAVYTPTQTATAPCGACRQVIHEFGPEVYVYSRCAGEARLDLPVSELLPEPFGPRNLSSS